jgi:hypothetical protein
MQCSETCIIVIDIPYKLYLLRPKWASLLFTKKKKLLLLLLWSLFFFRSIRSAFPSTQKFHYHSLTYNTCLSPAFLCWMHCCRLDIVFPVDLSCHGSDDNRSLVMRNKSTYWSKRNKVDAFMKVLCKQIYEPHQNSFTVWATDSWLEGGSRGIGA